MDTFEDYRKDEPVDALIVLGRGIEPSGELSETDKRRAIEAVYIGTFLRPRVVVFSGGRAWRQVPDNENMVMSEGATMLNYATRFATAHQSERQLPQQTEWLAEGLSTSLTGNFINSADLINLRQGEILGYLTDEVQDHYHRPLLLAQLVFPGHEILPLTIPVIDEDIQRTKEQTKVLIEARDKAIAEEHRIAFATKIAMFGVWPGNFHAIRRRQRALEAANRQAQNIGSRILDIFSNIPARPPVVKSTNSG